MMEQFIKTRDSLQCRSHHQKMLARYKSIARIIKELEKELLSTINAKGQKESETLKELIDYSSYSEPED